MQPGDSFFRRVLKIDVESGSSQEWQEEGAFPGEPIFVPHPEAEGEDQGVLLSVVLSGRYTTFMMCCDIECYNMPSLPSVS